MDKSLAIEFCLCSLVAGVWPDERKIEMQLGPEIKIEGKRPEWLKDDEKIGIVWRHGSRWGNLDTSVWAVHGWEDSVEAIMLPADHPYYLAHIKGLHLLVRR